MRYNNTESKLLDNLSSLIIRLDYRYLQLRWYFASFHRFHFESNIIIVLSSITLIEEMYTKANNASRRSAARFLYTYRLRN
jgi:hypothetical protein